jgi:hypothetical protein
MVYQNSPRVSNDISRLCELLEQKIAVFKDIMSATESLKDMITQQNTDAIDLILSRRNRLITAIDKIDNEILKIKGEQKINKATSNPEGQRRIQSLLKTLEHVIDKTLKLNQTCATAAEGALNGLKDSLTGLGNSSTSFKGYKNLGIPRFLDIKT